jgi:DNA-directed RNA polymerase specialized sigma24 family protein
MKAGIDLEIDRLAHETSAALDEARVDLVEAVRRALGSGTFAGDYLRAASGAHPAKERAAAIARLRVRLWQFPVRAKRAGALERLDAELNDCADAAIVLAIDRAREPQTIREREKWVKDTTGRKLTVVPVEYYDLGTSARFEAYLRRTAARALDEDIFERASWVAVAELSAVEDSPEPNGEADDGLSEWTVIAGRHPIEELVLTRAILAAGRLSAQERRVVELDANGYAFDEICVALGIRPGTLKSLRHRIRKNIAGRV